jgi:hypothetical protein
MGIIGNYFFGRTPGIIYRECVMPGGGKIFF